MAVEVLAFATVLVESVAGAELNSPHDGQGHGGLGFCESWVLLLQFWVFRVARRVSLRFFLQVRLHGFVEIDTCLVREANKHK